jgi:hypothetical protein
MEASDSFMHCLLYPWRKKARAALIHNGEGRNVCFCQQLNPYFSIIQPIE